MLFIIMARTFITGNTSIMIWPQIPHHGPMYFQRHHLNWPQLIARRRSQKEKDTVTHSSCVSSLRSMKACEMVVESEMCFANLVVQYVPYILKPTDRKSPKFEFRVHMTLAAEKKPNQLKLQSVKHFKVSLCPKTIPLLKLFHTLVVSSFF